MTSYERNNRKTIKKSNLLPQEIKGDKFIIPNQQDIAKEFNNFFTSVGLKLAKKIPDTDKTFQDFFTCHNQNMESEELNFFEFEGAFKSLKRNKAEGFDDLSSNIIIDAYDSFKNILFHLSKVSIQQEVFTISLKIANVTPIFKSLDKDNVSNYSSMSILPVFTKVLERIMCNRFTIIEILKAFLMKNNLVFKETSHLNMPYFNLHEV